MDGLTFLDKSAKSKRLPVYVLAGDEDFLKRQCRDAIFSLVLGDADPTFAVATYPGDKLDFSAVRNDLDTLPFLSPARVVVVEAADPFVTAHREALEKYVAKPSKIGVLVLDVKSFPETTKLAKALPDGAKLNCKALPPLKLPGWAAGWAKARYGKTFGPDAAALLIDLVGPQMGLLDQELDKLSVAVGAKPEIGPDDVDRLVGRSRAANAFRIMEAVGEGKPDEALTILGELFEEGEDALVILGPLTWQLRKLAAVGRLIARGLGLGPAMDAAGVQAWPAARQKFERQVRHLGRRRLDQIAEWLLEVNLGLKGGNPLPPRLQLERLIVRLARPRVS
jgi:DNA polymerase-3 subunit delta